MIFHYHSPKHPNIYQIFPYPFPKLPPSHSISLTTTARLATLKSITTLLPDLFPCQTRWPFSTLDSP